MKVEKEEITGFKPFVLKLTVETQQELDTIIAFANCRAVEVSDFINSNQTNPTYKQKSESYELSSLTIEIGKTLNLW